MAGGVGGTRTANPNFWALGQQSQVSLGMLSSPCAEAWPLGIDSRSHDLQTHDQQTSLILYLSFPDLYLSTAKE